MKEPFGYASTQELSSMRVSECRPGTRSTTAVRSSKAYWLGYQAAVIHQNSRSGLLILIKADGLHVHRQAACECPRGVGSSLLFRPS